MSTHTKYESSLPASENMHMPLTDTNYANMTGFLCKPEKEFTTLILVQTIIHKNRYN